jgi:hypothetical protein
MFKSMMADYEKYENYEEADDCKADMMIYQERSIKLLQKYATHPQLDGSEVLEIIPEDWTLTGETESTDLYSYLYASVSASIHELRIAKIKKNLSKMDHESVEIEWSEKRKASVRITNERVCAACKKKISDRVILVYPNGSVVHYTCMTSLSICPATNTNFESLA